MKLSFATAFLAFAATAVAMPLGDDALPTVNATKPSARRPNQLLHSIVDDHEKHGIRRLASGALSQHWNIRGHSILVRISSSKDVDDAADMLSDVESTGTFVATSKCSATRCYGWLDMRALDQVEALPSVRSMWPETMSLGNDCAPERPPLEASTVPVASGAVTALQVDKVRAKYANKYNTLGKGIKIGVLSDSFDFLGGYEQGLASGNLPNVTVLKEYEVPPTFEGPPPGDFEGPPPDFDGPPPDFPPDFDFEAPPPPPPGTDEGRAMLELIHDIVPEAELFFHTANGGAGAMAEGIRALAAAGCDVIVDDVSYPSEPFFQYGDVAAAANEVAEFQDVAYFSSAGNDGTNAYQSDWKSTACPDFEDFSLGDDGFVSAGDYSECLDFGNGSPFLRITTDSPTIMALQWDQPLGGCINDLDLLVFTVDGNDSEKRQLLPDDEGFLPFESNILNGNPSDGAFLDVPGTYDVAIALREGPAPSLVQLRYDGTILESIPSFSASTIVSQANAEFTAGVGAFYEQQLFGAVQLEPSTSRGGTPILFDYEGRRLAEPMIPEQPRFVGPDGTANSFFGLPVRTGPQSPRQWRFFGTSAAAPNVAAVAAMLLGIARDADLPMRPKRLYRMMQRSAIDVMGPDFDYDSGHGIINALAATEVILKKAGKVDKVDRNSHCDFVAETKSMRSGMTWTEICGDRTNPDWSKLCGNRYGHPWNDIEYVPSNKTYEEPPPRYPTTNDEWLEWYYDNYGTRRNPAPAEDGSALEDSNIMARPAVRGGGGH